jgi:chromate reductase
LRAAIELVPQETALHIFELDGIPGFNQDEEQNPPPKVIELKRRIREADAILIVTPEYNYSIPGVLKNAIDWASRPYGDSAWNGKPVAIMGLRSEPSARRGLNTIFDRYSSFSICFRSTSRR